MPGFGAQDKVASFTSTTFKPKKVRASVGSPCCIAYLKGAWREEAITAVPCERSQGSSEQLVHLLSSAGRGDFLQQTSRNLPFLQSSKGAQAARCLAPG